MRCVVPLRRTHRRKLPHASECATARGSKSAECMLCDKDHLCLSLSWCWSQHRRFAKSTTCDVEFVSKNDSGPERSAMCARMYALRAS